jgi:hypothetical protein
MDQRIKAMKTDCQPDLVPHAEVRPPAESTQQAAVPLDGKKRKRTSMHDGIAIWCDCCSCEAEPRWVEVGKELGIDMSDYEDADAEPPGAAKQDG